jgi:hypothetical protein
VDSKSQILSHLLVNFNSVNASLFEVLRELEKLLVVIEVGSVSKTAGPCEDGGDGVGGGRVALNHNTK